MLLCCPQFLSDSNNFKYTEIYPKVACPLFRKVINSNFRENGLRGNVEWIDADNDGNLDLLHKHIYTGDGSWNPEINLYHYDGTTFATREALPVAHPTDPWGNDSKGKNRINIPVDYNRDGKVDFLHFGQHTWQYNGTDWTWSGTFIFDNKGGSYEINSAVTSALYSQELHMHDKDIEQRVQGLLLTADFDMDGYPDVVTYKRGEDKKEGDDDVTRNAYPRLYKNEGGTFYGEDTQLPEVSEGTMALGDFNNDGRPDIVITGQTSDGQRQIWLCLNTTTEQHRYEFDCRHLATLDQYATILGAIAAGDLNNDGHLDLIITGKTATSDASFNILLNDGSNNFSAIENSTFPGLNCSTLDICDINGDGYADIAYQGAVTTSRENGAASGILVNQRDGSFVSCDVDMPQFRGGGNIRFADYNHDGHVSVAIMGYGNGGFGVYDQYVINHPTARKASARAALADDASCLSFRNKPYSKLECTKENVDGKLKLSWDNLGDAYSYNYIVKLKDGSMIYAIPATSPVKTENGTTSEEVDATVGPRNLLTGNTDQAIRSTSVTLNVNPDDVASYGVHAIAPDRTTSLIYLDSDKVITGIGDVAADDDENAPVEFYNLQGMRVHNPANGIFIRRQGTKVAKVAL